MIYGWIAASSMAAALVLTSSGAAAAEARNEARFAGHWFETNGPQPPRQFETRITDGKLSLAIPSDMAPPNGRTLWLQSSGPDLFKTAASDPVKAEFRLTAPGKAHLDIKSFSPQWTTITSTDLALR